MSLLPSKLQPIVYNQTITISLGTHTHGTSAVSILGNLFAPSIPLDVLKSCFSLGFSCKEDLDDCSEI